MLEEIDAWGILPSMYNQAYDEFHIYTEKSVSKDKVDVSRGMRSKIDFDLHIYACMLSKHTRTHTCTHARMHACSHTHHTHTAESRRGHRIPSLHPSYRQLSAS